MHTHINIQYLDTSCDHLGNVRVVSNDIKLRAGNSGPFRTKIYNFANYYPFGMQCTGTEGSYDANGDYRYGYNGKEKDDEIKGEANSLDYGARIYDPRVGRWMSVDPLESKYPMISPYCFAANNPIFLTDLNGEEPSAAAYKAAAEKLGVSVAHIRAVYASEVGKTAYGSDGKLKILYERHIFSKQTKGKFDKSNPDISNPESGGYGNSYTKLKQAISLDKEAAYASISIGGLQIMGFNYKNAGYNSAEEFVNAMINGTEEDHLNAFVNFVQNDKYKPKGRKTKLQALKDGDWENFAYVYNGPAYKKNKYHIKMEKFYNDFKEDPLKGLDESTENSTKKDSEKIEDKSVKTKDK